MANNTLLQSLRNSSGEAMEAHTFLNMVRDTLPTEYKAKLPIVEAGQESFTGVGQAINASNALKEIWEGNAITLIGDILMHSNTIYNDFAEYTG